MHPEILNPEQKSLLPLVKMFRREFYLVGGTAIALQIGHRKSVDFDLFKGGVFNSKKILNKIDTFNYRYNISRRVSEQLNISILDVKMIFFEYPYPIEVGLDFDKTIRMPDLPTLAAMKSFALGASFKNGKIMWICTFY